MINDSVSDDEIKYMGAADVDLAPGLKVGEYVIAEKIGEGGFGSVYKAEHPLIGKEAAVKVLNRKFSADPEMVSRFVAEARAVNQIRHRYIIDIFSFGQLDDGRSYYVMEFLRGHALDAYLGLRGPMALADALPILRSLAHALDAAHAKGIAHRDLKPENIFLVRDEQDGHYPKLLDFGIAKLLTDEGTSHKTRTGAPMGTPYYMSPEQCRGRDVDHRTDIYAFGCVAYKMLTNRVPFDGEDHLEILFKQIGEAAAPPSTLQSSLTTAVDDVVAWMMAKSVDERPATLCDAVDHLEKASKDPEYKLDRSVTLRADPQQTQIRGAQTQRRDADFGSMPTLASPPDATSLSKETQSDVPAVAVMGTVADALVGDAAVAGSRAIGSWTRKAGFALVALGAAALVAYLASGKSTSKLEATARQPAPSAEREPAQVAPVPAPHDEPLVVVVPDAGALSANVTVSIVGPPAGTEVYGPKGLLGVLPGSVQIPRGSESVQLSFRARGYQSTSMQVAADVDQAIEIELLAAERTRPASPRDTGAKAKGGKRQGRDAIEDPFAD